MTNTLASLVEGALADLLAADDMVAELLPYAGERCRSRACPLARYLTAKTGLYISVGVGFVKFSSDDPDYFTFFPRLELPKAIDLLVADIDACKYPQLVTS